MSNVQVLSRPPVRNLREKQDAFKHDDVAGRVRASSTNSTSVASWWAASPRMGRCILPWGLAIAPTGIGKDAGDLLVGGNFGDGTSARSSHPLNHDQYVEASWEPTGEALLSAVLRRLRRVRMKAGSSGREIYSTAGVKGKKLRWGLGGARNRLIYDLGDALALRIGLTRAAGAISHRRHRLRFALLRRSGRAEAVGPGDGGASPPSASTSHKWRTKPTPVVAELTQCASARARLRWTSGKPRTGQRDGAGPA